MNKVKHIPKHMKLPLIKNAPFTRRCTENKLIGKGYMILNKYLGGK